MDKKIKISVVIGRFQNENVCDVMDEFLQMIKKQSHMVIVFVGLSPVQATKENPLDFESRKLMLEVRYPTFEIAYIKDHRYDSVWSKNIDAQIDSYVGKNDYDVTIYGGEHTSLKSYSGKYKIKPIPTKAYINNDLDNQRVSSKIKETPEFRAGVIWATQKQYNKVYPTVDIAIFDKSINKFLFAKKPGETQFRFIGGFVDVNEKIEDAAKREVMEEANIEVENLQWLGSFVVNDWRYERERDCVTTTFFLSDYKRGIPRAQDDIAELAWLTFDELESEGGIVPEHIELLEKLKLHPPGR